MEELDNIECPLCKESFKDKRGLTSHARNKHELSKDKVLEKLTQKEQEKKDWKIIGSLATIVLTLIGLANFK